MLLGGVDEESRREDGGGYVPALGAKMVPGKPVRAKLSLVASTKLNTSFLGLAYIPPPFWRFTVAP